MATKQPAQYRVANPRNIPAEIDGERIPILQATTPDGVRNWYEGDPYTEKNAEELLKRGFLEKV